MNRPCSLCQTKTWPLAHAFFIEDGIERAVCVSCADRLAHFILDSEREQLTHYFHLPQRLDLASPAYSVEEESLQRYAELGLLDDALLEAADALQQIPDREICAHSLEVIFGLLRDQAWPSLRGRIFPN